MTDVRKAAARLDARANHFERSKNAWVYTRDRGDLEHIRYRSDHTGYNTLWRRLRRAFRPTHLLGRDRLSRQLGFMPKGFKDTILHAWAHVSVSLSMENNMPDGMVNGNIFFWEEDGEYVQLVGPTVGDLIAKWMASEPDSPYAIAIAEEMDRLEAVRYQEAGHV